MAEQFRQTDEGRQRFLQAIAEKERRRREDRVDRFEQTVPLIGRVLSPLANLLLWDEDNRNFNTGYRGESRVARTLRGLPAQWCFLNDIVLERAPAEWMQIDHIAVGPSGVAAIETKHWHGAIRGYRDTWHRKSNGRWLRLSTSPTRQAVWHAKALRRLLTSGGYEVPVEPVVVILGADWIREAESSCPVFTDVARLRRHLLARDEANSRGLEQCREIAKYIGQSYSLCERLPSEGLDGPSPAAKGSGMATAGHSLVKAATPKQQAYAAQLLRAANLTFVQSRLAVLTRDEAQAVIDRLRFHKDVALPVGLVAEKPPRVR